MTWCWPLANTAPLLPDAPGSFGAIRKHDVHSGVDLYCEVGQVVVAVEDGEVVAIEKFTGPNADDPSPWWNDTEAVLVRGASGVVVYGEVQLERHVRPGCKVRAGEPIAVVARPVLPVFKGRPTVMLHLELRTFEATGTTWWPRGGPQPPTLQDPTPHLVDAAGLPLAHFDLSTYDGDRFNP